MAADTHAFEPAALHEIATLLDTGLDRETISTIVSLCENGVNPEALAAVIKEMRREKAAADQVRARCPLRGRCPPRGRTNSPCPRLIRGAQDAQSS